MWQNDTVTFQTKTEVNTYGSIKSTWTASSTVACDVQAISKEKVLKDYGFTDANVYLEVFDRTLSTLWVEGNQVAFGGDQYLIRKVIDTNDKMGASNHVHVILSRVI